MEKIKINKHVSTFIREMRVSKLPYASSPLSCLLFTFILNKCSVTHLLICLNKMVQIRSKQIELVKIESNWLKLDQIRSNYVDRIGSNQIN